MDNGPTAAEIREVARLAVTILASNGLTCCLFGSAACALYGNSRKPNDVDIVVMTSSYDTEYLKQLLAKPSQTKFYLRPGKAPGATYKVLFARLPTRYSYRRSCKVDILVPGIMNIPFVESHRIRTIEGLPVLPLIALLLLKLQGWSDHRASTRSDMQQKQYVDVRDINQLLQVAAEKREDVMKATWLPESFVTAGQQMLNRYITTLRPLSSNLWKEIGFDIPIL